MLYVSEIGAERFRKLSMVTLMTGWAVGQIIFPILFIFVNNWRVIFAIIIGLPMIMLTIVLDFRIYETPRYLVSKMRYEEARQVLSNISVYNKRPSFEFRLYQEIEQVND